MARPLIAEERRRRSKVGEVTVAEGLIPLSRPILGEEEIREVADTLRGGWVTEGPKVHLFEDRFRQFVGSRYAMAVSSGTAALHAALAAAGIGEGDEVITTPFTFCASVNVILYVRAKPVLADISLDDYNIDPLEVEKKITPRTKAIIPVHFAGQPCRMRELQMLARAHGLSIIEDASHAAGAEYMGQRIGSIGDMTAFSFYASKNMTTGEGGMLTTDDDHLARQARLLIHQGLTRESWARQLEDGFWHYDVQTLGFKYNMSDVVASIGIHQLEKLPHFIESRQRVARCYQEMFRDVPEIVAPQAREEVQHAWHLFVIRLRREQLAIDRGQFINLMRERGIATSVHYIPIHYHSVYQKLFGDLRGHFPNTEAAYESVVSLPIHPGLTDAEAERVGETVIELVRRHRR